MKISNQNRMPEMLIDRFDAKIYGGGITMAKEYIEREAAKRELLSWAVSINHPEYLIKDDALHIIDSIPAADVVEQEQESKLLNGWISVKDRLPEDESDVLAYSRIGEEFRIYPACYSNGVWFDCVFNAPATDTTTHWMPMPNLPKM